MYCDSVQTTRRRVFAGPVALQQSSAWTFLARQSGTSSHSSSRSSGWSQNKLELEPSESRRWQRRARRSRNHRHIRSTMDSLLTAASLNPVHTQVVRADDTFELYDLKVEVVCPPNERILCGAKDGDYFILQGEMLTLPPGQGISIYSLSAVLPLLAAKQRMTHPNDWMTTDAEIACPDPHCKSRLKITRTHKRVFSHSAVTAVPLAKDGSAKEEH